MGSLLGLVRSMDFYINSQIIATNVFVYVYVYVYVHGLRSGS